MFSRIRRHCNFMTFVAFIALLFAMSGGAYAAGRYLITSTRQISPTVLKALKGGKGPAGANGAPGSLGAQGAPGSQGSQGPKGDTGAGGAKGETGQTGEQGAEGEPGPAGATGIAGAKGEPWTPNNTLPSKAMETGAWYARLPGEHEVQAISISFPIQLASALDETHTVVAPNAACPGNAEEPKAKAGFLCIYPGLDVNVKITEIHKVGPGGESGASTAGAYFFAESTEGPVHLATGSWAVTAE
jgi:Collagen triple helix repeat (20 copies)